MRIVNQGKVQSPEVPGPSRRKATAKRLRRDPRQAPEEGSHRVPTAQVGSTAGGRRPRRDLDRALQGSSADQWWELLVFTHHKLQAPAPDSRSTAAACIRRQISGETLAVRADEGASGGGGRRRRVMARAGSGAENGGTDVTSDDALARRVSGKVADGDIWAALQILASDEEFAPPDQEIITLLRAKHPPAPADQLLPPPLTDTDPAPLTASETDVKAAINSMRPGSVADLDGVRALRLLISKEAAESAA